MMLLHKPKANAPAAARRPRIPQHVAFIVDGNRRWARAHGRTVREGHREGADNIIRTLDKCETAGIGITTWWLLSMENLKRSEAELHGLLDIITDLVGHLTDCGRWRIRHLGDSRLVPDPLADALHAAERSSGRSAGPQVNLAVAYSGRSDIVAAVCEIARRVAADPLERPTDAPATERRIEGLLSTQGLPDPDLVIRTSGEQRLSGFMPWQTAHSEFYFSPTLWPDFTEQDLQQALDSYAHRQRRHGA
ncbi:polyprenyl diphosphate synthase [Streptomyces sp. NPDC006529]|uniref:polyprenyl diphosphate synthase n=1 Tax=Streptomyces sp. NPDC006529 TaxID=3157177 RepID=UPI0033BF0D27